MLSRLALVSLGLFAAPLWGELALTPSEVRVDWNKVLVESKTALHLPLKPFAMVVLTVGK